MDPKTVEKLEGKIGEAIAEIIVKMGLKKPRRGRNRGSSGWSIIKTRAARVKSPAPEGRRSRVESDKLRCLAFQPRLELRLRCPTRCPV